MTGKEQMGTAVTYEGPDNSMKSTYLGHTVDALCKLGFTLEQLPTRLDVGIPEYPTDCPLLFTIKEPGFLETGGKIRQVLLGSPDSADLAKGAYPLLYYADRLNTYQVVEQILQQYPLAVVLGDRCELTTITMQLNDMVQAGVPEHIARERLETLIDSIWEFANLEYPDGRNYPQRVFIFDVDPEEAYLRDALQAKTVDTEGGGNWRDRIPRAQMDFIRTQYLEWERKNPERAQVFNSMLPPTDVLPAVVKSLISGLPGDISSRLRVNEIDSVVEDVVSQDDPNTRMSPIQRWEDYRTRRSELDATDLDVLAARAPDVWKSFGINDSGVVEP